MKYLIGSKKEFYDFINSITKEDKIGIITHTDLDGIASAIFLEKILESKNLKGGFIEFLTYEKGMFDKVSKKLKEKKISKVFLTDLGADNSDMSGFEKLRKEFDVFLIDHHPVNPNLKNIKNVIKTETSDCAALILYDLAKNFFDVSGWDWLIHATIIADWSYRNPKNMEFLREKYPKINEENLFEFESGKICNNIGSALIYYRNNLKRVYDSVLKKDLDRFEKINKIIFNEINKYIKKFEKESDFYPEKNLYFVYFSPKFEISSVLSTIISKKDLEGIFVVVTDIGGGFVKVSARSQGANADVGALMEKGIKGLEDVSAGGHKRAAGARINKKYLNKFKENILR